MQLWHLLASNQMIAHLDNDYNNKYFVQINFLCDFHLLVVASAGYALVGNILKRLSENVTNLID